MSKAEMLLAGCCLIACTGIDFDNSKAMVDDGLNGEIPCYVVDAEFGPQPESAWDY